ncbi:MAG: HDOD domain-containing protein [Ignavibacteria bacterium]|nr:HDOD domain-containing protein [Ignavibacteria bacterium]
MHKKKQHTLTEQEIRDRLNTLSHFPVLDSFSIDILQLLEEPSTTPLHILRAIETNPSLVVQILKKANSLLYGFPRKISTVEFALSIIGFDIIKEIIALQILHSHFEQKSECSIQSLWEHSFSTAVIAKRIARDVEYPVVGEAFTAGLLHDIGIAVFQYQFANEFSIIMNNTKKTGTTFEEEEQRIFGEYHHAIVGGWLAERWNFSPSIVESITFHHNPTNARKYQLLSAIVHCAEVFSNNYSSEKILFDSHSTYNASAVQLLESRYAGFERRFLHQENMYSVEKISLSNETVTL